MSIRSSAHPPEPSLPGYSILASGSTQVQEQVQLEVADCQRIATQSTG
jgi:hypothetical protein